MPSPALNPREIALLQRPVSFDGRVHVLQARAAHRRAYVKWSAAEDALLRRLFQDGLNNTVIAQVLERNLSGIEARTKKLGLIVIKPPKPPRPAAAPATTARAAQPSAARAAVPVTPLVAGPVTPRVPATPTPRGLQSPAQLCAYCVTSVPAGALTCPNCGAPIAPLPSHRLPVGTKLQGGRYSVGKVIGEGGFGITYMGANIALRQQVAIKEFYPHGATRNGNSVLPPRGLSAQDFATERAKCLEEARRIGRFHHASIVKVADVFEEHSTVYMVMEYLNGQSLEARVQQRGPLPPLEVARIGEQLLSALEQIHASGLLHRDIKPDNVMLCQDATGATRAVLIDFGAAREFQSQRTQMHSLILTPGYAPLEQYGSNLRRNPSSDLYALGGTLYYALTARPPPPATERINGASLESLPEDAVQQALGLSEAITAALRIRVDERPQTALEMLERIRWKPRNAAAEPPAWLERLMRALKISTK